MSVGPIMNHINHGKINMHLKTHILHSEIFQLIIYLKRNWNRKGMNLINSSHFPDLCRSMRGLVEQEEEHRQLYRKKLNSNHHLQKVELSKKEMCLHHNFVVTMTGGTSQFESTIKALCPNWSGRFQQKALIITITCLFSLTDADKRSILTDHSL